LRAIQENFEEGYVKKSGNEGECLSILRGAKKKKKKRFQWKKDTTNAKIQHQKNQVSCL
jgi:hypothetical protein